MDLAGSYTEFESVVTDVDTAQIYFRHRLESSVIEFLKARCGSFYQKQHEVGETIHLHQPTPEVFGKLEKIFRKGDFINRLDFAVNFVTQTWQQANDAAVFLQRCLYQRWSRDLPTVCVTTSYTKQRRWGGANTASYATGRKTEGQPAIHLESRITSAEKLRSVGIRRPIDVLTFNCAEFWRRCWGFATFSSYDVLRAAQDRGAEHPDRAAVTLRRAIACDEAGAPSAAAWRVMLRRMKLSDVGRVENFRWLPLLLPPENAFHVQPLTSQAVSSPELGKIPPNPTHTHAMVA